jgi:mannose/fructose/N-acetylgalactosamine-specific phosphotransferase system component IIC
VITALSLTLLSVLCLYDGLSSFFVFASRPLMAGTLAGLLIGHPVLGMAIGATLELASLGVYQYGGATIPDYQTGAIVGTALAAGAGGQLSAQVAIGIGIGLPAAVLLSALDPIGRLLPAFMIHRADRYAAEGNGRGLALMHWTGFIPWALTRAVPTFLASLAASTGLVQRLANGIPPGFIAGMTLAGTMLPAVGFALLLTMMPIRRYWYMPIIGFVLFAYLKVPLLGIALFGVAIAAMFIALRPREVDNV